MSFIIFPGVITPPLTPGAVPYGTGSNVLMNAQGTAGQALISTGAGAPIWSSAVPSSTNIGGGIAGDLPYQSAPSTTTFRNLVPGAVVYGDATAPNYTAVGTAGQVLQSNATGAPSWTTNISGNAANVTGTVAVANGGTGLATLTAENVILGDGTNNVKFVAPGSNGNVLTSNGTTWTSAAPSGAALVYLSTTTTASSANLSIDLTPFTSTYNAFKIVCTNVWAAVTGTTSSISVKINNNSSNYNAGAGGGQDTQGAGQFAWGSRQTTQITVFSGSVGFVTDDTGHVSNFEIDFFNMNTSARKFFVGFSAQAIKVGSAGGTGAGGSFGGMWVDSTQPTSVNIVAATNFAGTFLLYGIKTS